MSSWVDGSVRVWWSWEWWGCEDEDDQNVWSNVKVFGFVGLGSWWTGSGVEKPDVGDGRTSREARRRMVSFVGTWAMHCVGEGMDIIGRACW